MHTFITGAASARLIVLQMMDERTPATESATHRKQKRVTRRARWAARRAERSRRRAWRPDGTSTVSLGRGVSPEVEVSRSAASSTA